MVCTCCGPGKSDAHPRENSQVWSSQIWVPLPISGWEETALHFAPCSSTPGLTHTHPPLPQEVARVLHTLAVFGLPLDFPPVFHIKLKDQVLLEGEAATLLCLPAACPAPRISWMKGKEIMGTAVSDKCRRREKPGLGVGMVQGRLWGGARERGLDLCRLTQQPLLLLPALDKQSLRSEPSVVIVSCKDGRQLLSIPRASKRHAGLYECSATNVLGSITSSCTVAVARESGAGPQGE